MQAVARAFWLPKAGNTADEYEDAFALPGPSGRRFAIADGATETSFSGLWARLLAETYSLCDHNQALLSAIPALRAVWQKQALSRPLPWYAEEKAQKGAFTSLLGLALRPRNTGVRWHAMAVGDSCLFQVRGDRLAAAFPLESSDQFGSRPILIGSQPGSDRPGCWVYRSGDAAPGDTFYLMTDALACWFLRRQEEDSSGIACLSDVQSAAVFEQLVEESRRERDSEGRPALRNDDVTLVRIDLAGDPIGLEPGS